MNLTFLKSLAEKIPEPIGRVLAVTPYSWRLGIEYRKIQERLAHIAQLDISGQKAWVEDAIYSMANWAKINHPFFQDFYKYIEVKKGFDNFKNIPILTKSDLQKIPLEQRSTTERGRYLSGTGGTSGQSLGFYIDSRAFAREWAHMHFIWKKLGYQTTDLKLVLRGKNLGKQPLVYNPIHNEYMVNAYCPYDQVCESLWKKMQNNQIRFLHGYPSAIYEFIQFCQQHRNDITDKLRKNLKGILYASEYPAPIYRDFVEDCLGVKSISWYGHSEFSVLAYEVEKYIYTPLHTYGYAETVANDEGHQLVCTGYYNRVCPFIRYNTEDLIEPLEEHDGILRTFKIAAGRVGDFITDLNGKQISLTALIFGRHHKLFGHVNFLQITQNNQGTAIIILTCKENINLSKNETLQLLDLTNIDVTFDILFVAQPFRTKAGKVLLKVPYNQLAQEQKAALFNHDKFAKS